MHHSTVTIENTPNTCISTESMFFERTMPPYNSASAGMLIIRTSAVDTSIHAVSPLFGVGAGAAVAAGAEAAAAGAALAGAAAGAAVASAFGASFAASAAGGVAALSCAS